MKVALGIIIVLVLLGGGWFLTSQNAPAPTETHTEAGAESAARGIRPVPGSYTVAPEESSIAWSAGKPLIAGYVHTGTLNVASGTIEVGDATASGSFVIDMASVKVTSLGGGKEGRESQLEAHLKRDDFFGTEEYPTGTFTITSVVPTEGENQYTVTGNLTLKDVTNEVSFVANIYEEEGQLHAHADFAIDRTKWGITFASASVFDNLANNAIGDEVNLSLKLIANPAQ